MRRLVYISGAPGAGKSSLAVPLAAELGFTLISKDRIKEKLHDALGAPEPDLTWSRRLGAAAMELLWSLAADSPAAVIEANFRPHSGYQRERLMTLSAFPVEVRCLCPPELALARYNARTRHPVHVLTTLDAAAMAEYDRPVGVGALVTVHTTAPADVPAVAAAVLAGLAACLPRRRADADGPELQHEPNAVAPPEWQGPGSRVQEAEFRKQGPGTAR